MKQTQPYTNIQSTIQGPMIEFDAWSGSYILRSNWGQVWTTPATKNAWTNIALDVVYSQNPSVGSIQVTIGSITSPVFHIQTLAADTGDSYYAAGRSIPDHLRLGIYHNPIFSCPAPTGCSVDVTNVAVRTP